MYRNVSAKRFKHKKRHEAQYATPADAEVIMKRRDLPPPAYTIPNLLYLHYMGMSRKITEKATLPPLTRKPPRGRIFENAGMVASLRAAGGRCSAGAVCAAIGERGRRTADEGTEYRKRRNWQTPTNVMVKTAAEFNKCGRGGIGRHVGFRFQWISVQVQVLSPVP